MGDATRAYFIHVLGDVLSVVDEESVDHLVIGTIATCAHFGDEWDPKEDIDLLIRESDAMRCCDAFAARGYATHVRDESWVYKVAKPNVTIDLIFRSERRIELDAQMLRRSATKPFEGLDVPIPSIEDMAVHYVLMDGLDRRHFYDAIRYVRAVSDWRYLVARALELAPRKMFATLLYAAELGLDVPRSALVDLSTSTLRRAV